MPIVGMVGHNLYRLLLAYKGIVRVQTKFICIWWSSSGCQDKKENKSSDCYRPDSPQKTGICFGPGTFNQPVRSGHKACAQVADQECARDRQGQYSTSKKIELLARKQPVSGPDKRGRDQQAYKRQKASHFDLL